MVEPLLKVGELSGDLARAEEQVSRLVIAREEVTRVLEEPAAAEPPVGLAGQPAGEPRSASPIGTVTVPPWQEGAEASVLPPSYQDLLEAAETGPAFPAGLAGLPSSPAGGSAAAGSSMTRVTSSRAIASREACSSALARSPESSSIRIRSRSASARAAASRRRSSSISEPIPVSFPLNTTVEDQPANQPAIRKNRWPEVPSEERTLIRSQSHIPNASSETWHARAFLKGWLLRA